MLALGMVSRAGMASRHFLKFAVAGALLWASMAACTPAPPESPRDAAVSARVERELASAGIRSGYPLHVRTENGNVTLSGFAMNDAQRVRAGAAAATVPGVSSVENHLVVMPPKGNPNPPQGSASPR